MALEFPIKEKSLKQLQEQEDCTLLRLIRELQALGVSPDVAAESATEYLVAIYEHL